MEKYFHSSWHELIPLFKEDPKLVELGKILTKVDYYPKDNSAIFKVFQVPVDDIKVIILGMDPYPQPNVAIGRAFAVNSQSSVPASLRIIKKELISSKNIIEDNENWKTLEHWENQGVLLLNTALTVEKGNAGSHIDYWKDFTNLVIDIINTKLVNPIWLLWGLNATKFKSQINSTNILTAPHPASECYRPGTGFIGCNHFNIVNELLTDKIKW